MNTVILDYPPPAGQPYEGKFLQLTLHGREYLLFAPRALHQYHNQILAHFLEDQGLAHRWLDRETLRVEAPELRVIGGGRYRVDTRAGTLALWDNSQAYGRFDERGLAQKIAAAGHPWSGFTVRIG